jgi:hypothetical protein
MKLIDGGRIMPVLPLATIAAVLLAGAGAALAQQGSGRSAAGNAAATPPAISSASPAAQDPGVNPSAAGTQPGGDRSGGVAESAKGGGEHGGSKSLSANTHPFAALKANKQLRRRQQTEQILQGRTTPPRTAGSQVTQGSESGAGR